MKMSLLYFLVIGLYCSNYRVCSQETIENYPDISGIWESGGTYGTVFQFKDSIYYSFISGGSTWNGRGKYIGKDKFKIHQVTRSENGCKKTGEHYFTIIEKDLLINTWVFNESKCGVTKGQKGSNNLRRVDK